MTTNYGNDQTILTKYQTGVTGYLRKSYVKFDLSDLASSTIASANLKLYDVGTNASAYTLGAYQVADSSWTELGITWNIAPALGSVISTSNILDTDANKYKEIDVTAYINQELGLGHKIITIGLNVSNSSVNVGSFNSKEAGAGTEPKLVLYK